LTIYLGPVLMIGLCSPLIVRIVRLAKAQNITSIADFIAARYGKDHAVSATVAVIAIMGTVPYIALQLKAVSGSLSTILAQVASNTGYAQPVLGDLALFVALSMAAFAVLFGTRHIDATEHQDGLMLAIATESLVKLVAFVAVGIFVTFVMFDGPFALFAEALRQPDTAAVLTREHSYSTLVAMTLLSFFAIVLLPRQFHVTVVENRTENEIRRAAWLFPLYLGLINLFVVPIAMAGLLMLPAGSANSDMFVLALPLAAGSDLLTIAAFIGGLSAATAMVIVESVALSIMVSNDIVVPWVLKRRQGSLADRQDMGALLLQVRRIAIFVILLLAYSYYHSTGAAQLASIGLLSFAAVAQLAPAFFGGLIWRGATGRGAIAGITIGMLIWAYTLLLPSIAHQFSIGQQVLAGGPWDIDWLRPEGLAGVALPPLVHGVVWSLGLNILAYIALSLLSTATSIERLQAELFVPSRLAPITPSFRLWRSSVTVDELMTTVSRYLGEDRTRNSLQNFASARALSLEPTREADFELLRYCEYLLASAIGAASSRLVLSLLLRKRTLSTRSALKLLDDASAAIHYNREILQTALNHVGQGIAVFDKDLQLLCWNRQFGEVVDLPPEFTRIGLTLEEMLRIIAARGALGPGDPNTLVSNRLRRYISDAEPFLERFVERGLVVEVRASRMPDAGFVITFTDITPSVAAAEALERANASLERRVRERTAELTHLNAELARAKSAAEEANISKTRFLAAASHDILQPLNAARLYVTSLVERPRTDDDAALVANVDASLEAVEEILGALLDISRLDSGAMPADVSSFPVGDLLRRLEVEFAPLAREKGLQLIFVRSSLSVKSDRRLLRRLLQNLVSNAIKYTPAGRVLIGCRARGDKLRIDVYDTGIGIPASKRHAIFHEFHRLDEGAKVARGLGLGLSIVERIARVLDHQIEVDSIVAQGSHFSVYVPLTTASAAIEAQPAPVSVDRRQLVADIVLCIDNEPQILDGMQALLGGWGCMVIKAANVAQALSAVSAANAEPNCVLVDYHLDEGNGIVAIAELRDRFGEDLPAILITADRSPQVRADAQACGIQVLNKPLKPAALRALLAQMQVRRLAAAE
jgi:Na+/proline symporter/CheY-like chemotaxis protein/anti-sigma regulatory factor (Ser/Thr protein kinase)